MGCESPQALTNVSHSSASGYRLKALCVLPCYLETADWMSNNIMNALQNKNLPDDRAVGGADLILDDESAQWMYCLEPLCMLSGFRPAEIEKQPLNFYLAKRNRNHFNPLPQRQSSVIRARNSSEHSLVPPSGRPSHAAFFLFPHCADKNERRTPRRPNTTMRQ